MKGTGTDGNVYIQLFGERGNTAKIQLRQAGDSKNKFEKGRTYKFTVDTVDIGKVGSNCLKPFLEFPTPQELTHKVVVQV